MHTEQADVTIYYLKIDFLDDGDVSLEQSAGHGDSYYVTLHQTHIRFIAERVGLIPALDMQARIKELEAALNLLEAVVNTDGTPEHLRTATAAVVASLCIPARAGTLDETQSGSGENRNAFPDLFYQEESR